MATEREQLIKDVAKAIADAKDKTWRGMASAAIDAVYLAGFGWTTERMDKKRHANPSSLAWSSMWRASPLAPEKE